MPLDHYISQVHLRSFVAPELDGRLHAIRKSDLKRFAPRPQDVCRIESGNTNRYLEPKRLIEEFLRGVEPKYNSAIENLRSGEIDHETVYVVAGFVAYVMTCSPGGIRINAAPHEDTLKEVGRRLDKNGKFPTPPEELGGRSFTELLDSGDLTVKVDPKWAQAIGITLILDFTSMFGNFRWEILSNRFEDSPFFTSDYPVAIESGGAGILNRIIPLAPNLALRICPDRNVDRDTVDFTFRNFNWLNAKVSRSQVRYLNSLFVRSAEDTVFFQRDLPWVDRFVESNAGYRIEPVCEKFPFGKGMVMMHTSAIKKVDIEA